MFNGDFDPERDFGSLFRAARVLDAEKAWDHGLTGRGVDVALLDSGVAPVTGLDAPGKIVNGVDVSTEASHPEVAYLDGYGHGTHMAGIIAGRDPEVIAGKEKDDKRDFLGMAPDARIVNVKAADTSGATDVSQVLAGIDWVVQHRTSNGLNIRVLNLSFGTDGVQDYQVDPLAYAVEVAWRKGIFVVVSAGNRGYGSPKLNNPASDPYVLAVGASNPNNTDKVDDDTVPSWSSRGDTTRGVDLVAPGQVDHRPAGARLSDRRHRPPGPGRAALLPRQRHQPGRRGRLGRGRPATPAAPRPHSRPAQGPAGLHRPAAQEGDRDRAGPRHARGRGGPGGQDPDRGGPDLADRHRHRIPRAGPRHRPHHRHRRRRPHRRAGPLRRCLGRPHVVRADVSGNAWSSVQWGGDQDPLVPLSEVTSP